MSLITSARGGLLRVTSYTSSGTWTKTNETGLVVVEVVGGGGATGFAVGSHGGMSSFGSHCSATGGQSTSTATGGAAGSGSSGDLNVSGEPGLDAKAANSIAGIGGASNYGVMGAGATQMSQARGGGGGGGYSMKAIAASSLSSSESVTVGAAGTFSSSGVNGRQGIVIVYEYSR